MPRADGPASPRRLWQVSGRQRVPVIPPALARTTENDAFAAPWCRACFLLLHFAHSRFIRGGKPVGGFPANDQRRGVEMDTSKRVSRLIASVAAKTGKDPDSVTAEEVIEAGLIRIRRWIIGLFIAWAVTLATVIVVVYHVAS